MKLRIINSDYAGNWYHAMIGETFDVIDVDFMHELLVVDRTEINEKSVRFSDAEVFNEAERN